MTGKVTEVRCPKGGKRECRRLLALVTWDDSGSKIAEVEAVNGADIGYEGHWLARWGPTLNDPVIRCPKHGHAVQYMADPGLIMEVGTNAWKLTGPVYRVAEGGDTELRRMDPND